MSKTTRPRIATGAGLFEGLAREASQPRYCRNCGSRTGCDCYERAQELLRFERDRATSWETKCDDALAKVATLEATIARMAPVVAAADAWRDDPTDERRPLSCKRSTWLKGRPRPRHTRTADRARAQGR